MHPLGEELVWISGRRVNARDGETQSLNGTIPLPTSK